MAIDWDAAGSWPQLATRIPPDLHRELKMKAVREEVSMMKLVVEGIRWRLRQKEAIE